MYIRRTPNEAGSYSNPQGAPAKGLLCLPDDLLTEYIEYKGFVILTVENDTVTALEKNAEAFDAWMAEVETEEEPTPGADHGENTIYDELAAAYHEGVQEA